MVGTPDNPGCMVKALNDLFEAMGNTNDVVFKVRVKLFRFLVVAASVTSKSCQMSRKNCPKILKLENLP